MGDSSWAPAPTSPSIPSRYHFDSHPSANPLAVVEGSRGDSHWRFTLIDEVVIRYEWSPDGGFEDRASTFALFRNFTEPVFEIFDSGTHLRIQTASLELVYDRTEFSPKGLQIRGRNGAWQWQYDGKSYGDLGGTARTLDGVDGRMPLAPGLVSRHQPYSVLDDSESMLFEADGWIGTRKPGRKDGYFFAYGTQYADAIRCFYAISGFPPLLPRWALGNWWSRYHEYTDREYVSLMDRFKAHNIPISVGIIDMDWHLVDIPSKYGTGWTGYTWNKDLFPDPKAFLAELRKRGLKVALNDHPAEGIRSFEDLYEDVAEALHRDTSKGEPIEFDCCDRGFMDAYFDVLKAKLEDQGVDFWWIDWQQGEGSKLPGVDPLWVLNHFHYLTSMRNAKTIEQPMTFSRYAGPGSHRYPVGFSGDTVISWETLKFQPEFTATASNIGYGWWSHDIGGHWGGIRSNELTARWVQLGCFSPMMRLHSTKNRWNSKEPWNFEPQTDRIMTSFLQLRHRLIPFLYALNRRAAYESKPLVQPLYWKQADRSDQSYAYPNQFYFGPDLLVAPITQPTNPVSLLAAVPVWLPGSAPRYVDILRPSLVYSSLDREFTLHRPLSTLPVLAPEGTILVLDGTTPSSPRHGVARPTDLEIWLVVGASGSFDLVEEPVHSNTPHMPAYDDFANTPISWNQDTGILSIGPARHSRPADSKRTWRLKLVGLNRRAWHPWAPRRLAEDGENSTVLNLGDAPSVAMARGQPFHFGLGRNLQLDVVDVGARIKEVIHRAETPYAQKDEIWKVVGDETRPVGERVEGLWGMEGVDEALKAAIMEVWAADGRAEGSAVGWERWGDGEDVMGNEVQVTEQTPRTGTAVEAQVEASGARMEKLRLKMEELRVSRKELMVKWEVEEEKEKGLDPRKEALDQKKKEFDQKVSKEENMEEERKIFGGVLKQILQQDSSSGGETEDEYVLVSEPEE